MSGVRLKETPSVRFYGVCALAQEERKGKKRKQMVLTSFSGLVHKHHKKGFLQSNPDMEGNRGGDFLAGFGQHS